MSEKKRVFCLDTETGEEIVYDSIYDCAQQRNISRGVLYKYIYSIIVKPNRFKYSHTSLKHNQNHITSSNKEEIILVFGDVHQPYEHPKAFDFICGVAEQWKPTKVVCVGDFWDFYAFSRFEKSPEGLSPTQEYKEAVKLSQKWYKRFPDVLYCKGNHCERIERRIYTAGIPAEHVKPLKEIMKMPKGWDIRDSHYLCDINFEHGHGNISGQYGAFNRAMQRRETTVCGHYHSGLCTIWQSSGKDGIAGAYTGCLCDPSSLAMQYGNKAARRSALGCVIIAISEKFGTQLYPIKLHEYEYKKQ